MFQEENSIQEVTQGYLGPCTVRPLNIFNFIIYIQQQ